MRNLYILERCIGKGEPTFIIAEVGQAHEGSLALAHSFIDSVADTGADAVKFQTHLAEYESTLNEPFRAEFRTEDETRYEYWKRMEFTEAQWTELADHAKRVGLTFLSTAFCKPAVDLLKTVGVPAWKVGSGEYNSMDLVAYMAETGFPVLLSTGMSTFEEIGDIVATVNDRGAPLAIFQCTSKYPTEMEDVGLNMLDELADTFGCSVGLSDHSGTIYPGMAAIARGADLLEVHVTFDRRLFHPDGKAAITFDELEILVSARDAIQTMDRNPVDKNQMAARLSDTRALFSKSIAPRRELPKGTTLTEEMIVPKKPGSGIPYEKRDRVIGRTLVNRVSPNRLLTKDDLDG